MGATSWRYYTPYCPDAEAALQTLRSEVFARGEYTDPTGPLEQTLRQMALRFGLDPDAPEVREEIDQDLRVQKAVETGNCDGLSRAEKALVKQLREAYQLAELLGAAQPITNGSPPNSIDELLERAAESGTHSILDIEQVAARAGFGFASPLTATRLSRVFGTPEPTRDQVEQSWPDIAEPLSRWQARYFIVYREGQPHEYVFIGCSGD